jgi:hypothetical protein
VSKGCLRGIKASSNICCLGQYLLPVVYGRIYIYIYFILYTTYRILYGLPALFTIEVTAMGIMFFCTSYPGCLRNSDFVCQPEALTPLEKPDAGLQLLKKF